MKWIVAALIIWGVWMLLRKSAPKIVTQEAAARRLLGVGAKADAATIRAAHRRLLGQTHPDRGGDTETARQLNAARDLLLSQGE